ncbi:MAG: Na+ dependent nucleoside transporter N-terminal domain-containing protein, partial [Algoriphagus sp.]
MDYARGAFGILVIVLVAYLFSSNKKKIDWRLVAIGISLQLVFGFLITQVTVVKDAFQFLSEGFVKFLSFSEAGARFIFGDLAGDSFGFIFAFKVLPTIIFFSTVSSGLYYLGILQKVVYGIAWVMARS